MVCIMVEGGMRSLEIAISTLRKGTGKAEFVPSFLPLCSVNQPSCGYWNAFYLPCGTPARLTPTKNRIRRAVKQKFTLLVVKILGIKLWTKSHSQKNVGHEEFGWAGVQGHTCKNVKYIYTYIGPILN